jgi:hypothetical protein
VNRAFLLSSLFALSTSVLVVGCGIVTASQADDDEATIALAPGRYFEGNVYDGVTGARLTDYALRLQYFGRAIDAVLDDGGRYFVGPLATGHDFTVAIDAAGYRSFSSHNAFLVDAGTSGGGSDTRFFDAYLFPADLGAPADVLRVTRSDGAPATDGAVRFVPTAESSLIDDASETPAGVAGQVWSNDDQLQLRTIVRPIVDGAVSLAENDLVYGVRYRVTIFGVSDQAPLDASYDPGRERGAAFALRPLVNSSLALVFVSTDLGVPVPDGRVTFVLNQPVVIDPLTAAPFAIFVDSIDTVDADDDGDRNVLADRTFSTITIDGPRIEIAWDPAQSLDSTDVDDPIFRVRYSGLSDLVLRRDGGNADEGATLAQLLGSNSVTVALRAQ